ncbi:MAG TPA: alpha/beta hydrolase [Candidatus Manganitrophaceae bacterium]|nr:alpha/beta hydrolase [Candidatus Manganitrophaceae bacterium]
MRHPKTIGILRPRRLLLLSSLFLLSGCRMEKSFIFFPEKEIVATPSDAGLSFEDLTITASDGVKINGWWIPFPASRTTLLWFHGNAGNLSGRVDSLSRLHRKVQVNILMIDYREYGRSEGTVSELGTYLDALAAYDTLLARNDIDPQKIVAFGQSLGAAVATELALRRDLQGLILEAPFASIREMARVVFPYLPIGRFLSTRYDILSKIGKIKTPLLVLHGDQDEIIPYSQGRRVFEAAPEPKTFYTIPGARHNDTSIVGGKEYYETIARFINHLPDSIKTSPSPRLDLRR